MRNNNPFETHEAEDLAELETLLRELPVKEPSSRLDDRIATLLDERSARAAWSQIRAIQEPMSIAFRLSVLSRLVL